MRLDRLCLQAEADNPRFSYDDEGRLLPRSPLARVALLGSAVTAVAQAELALLTEQVTGPIVWHHVVSLLILPAIALRRRARLGSILVAAVGLVASPLIGPAPVAVPYLALLFLLASLGWFASLRRGLVGVAATLVCGLGYGVATGGALVTDEIVNARETDVLREIARGRSNLEIARTLHVSDWTVKTHVAALLRQLQLRNRTQAAVAAYELGLVRPGEGD